MDELYGIILLRYFGERFFLNHSSTKQIKLVFADAGISKYGNKSVFEHLRDSGRVFLGIMDSPFNEHTVIGGHEEIAHECATSLLVYVLGIHEEPCVKRILQFTKDTDLHPLCGEFELPNIIKTLYRAKRIAGHDSAVATGLELIEAYFLDCEEFYNGLRGEIASNETKHFTGVRKNLTFHVCALETSSELADKCLRALYLNHAVSIIRNPTGHVVIMFNSDHVDISNSIYLCTPS